VNKEFEKAFKQLNNEQRRAVEAIDGPVLVIAGPGTGKTQLLSTRIAYILKNTDTPANAILCLTFTESGADSLRQRLEAMIGQAAYEVQIATYHAFGSDLLRRYPEYAPDWGLEPMDDLGRYNLLASLVGQSPPEMGLRADRQTIKAMIGLISDAKRALLSAEDVIKTTDANIDFINQASKIAAEVLGDHSRLSVPELARFEQLAIEIAGYKPKGAPKNIEPLGEVFVRELKAGLESCHASGKAGDLSDWKRRWLSRDRQNRWQINGLSQQRRLRVFGELYQAYNAALQMERLFDYDDMILQSISALENNSDFKYTVAEHYLYIMLDEYQDTNAAQARIIELLSDSPVHEGKPNVMAVGDDDQAIYAFQGANYSNMATFRQMYKGVKLIPLTDNYRSHGSILDLAEAISRQIDGRLVNEVKGISKKLQAVGDVAKEKAVIERVNLRDAGSHYAYVAETVAKLKAGDPDITIGVLAPKHRHIEPLVPFLTKHGLPVSYERQEHIFDEPAIHQLLTMSRLVTALAGNEVRLADSLWPEVLSYNFWQLETSTIWQLAWQAADAKKSLTEIVMSAKPTKPIGAFFGRLGHLHQQTTMEQQLDALIGYEKDIVRQLKLPLTSPFYDYYFSAEPEDYLAVLAQLTVLRQALRDRQRTIEKALKLADFVKIAADFELADIKLLNTSPLRQNKNAVELMTAYKAKGREFDAVFLLHVQDEAWGPLARGQTDRLSLPANLEHIRYQGDSDDERLRLLYVGITRAKSHLYMVNFSATDNGKPTHALRYLAEAPNEAGQLISPFLPGSEGVVKEVALDSSPIETAQINWQSRHLPPVAPDLASLLSDRLKRFSLSPTHLNKFTDLVYGGPEIFYMDSLLNFPKAPTVDGQFGNAIHETLQWYGQQVQTSQPKLAEVLATFEQRLASKKLSETDTSRQLLRGQRALTAYLEQAIDILPIKKDQFEARFGGDGVFTGPAHLNGRIDRLRLNQKDKLIEVVDYKTGAPASQWDKSSPKHHKYIQQLMTYKLLVEGSPRFRGFRLSRAAISFVEPDEEGKIQTLWLDLDSQDMKRHQSLLVAVWHKIMALDFPDVSGYAKTISGIRAFEDDLLK
jgi:DNA helicase II / ATP-dependent DNA helicase PcrA